MNIQLSERMLAVVESSTLKMNTAAKALAAKGVKVINFAAGEPDFPVPLAIQNAAKKAIDDGYNKYTAVPGLPELRKGISEKLKKENHLPYEPEQIVVGTGAKQTIFNFLLALVDAGDEVIVPSPYWVSYPEMVKIAGGNPVIIQTQAAQNYKLTPAQLKKAMTPRTKALILNSPSNPAGIVYSASELKALAKVLEGTDILVCSDEIYEKLVFEGSFCSFGAVSEDAFKRTITINGFSKAFCMTGWRLGYAAGPRSVIDAMSILQGQSTSGASSIVQYAGLAALTVTNEELQPMIEAFRKRRDLMTAIFSEEKQLSYIMPNGAFYLFLNVEKVLGRKYNGGVVATSDDLAMYLLNTAHVATVPGSGFGHPEYIRLSFAVGEQDVKEGVRRIVSAVRELQS